ncbi:MAG: DUF4421 domain-containing protein [Bacteroidales bacterium]
MRKLIACGFIMIFSIQIGNAQQVESGINLSESLKDESSKRNLFHRAVDFFFGDFDSVYVSPSQYELSLMAVYSNNNEYYTLRSKHPEKQTLRLTHRPQNKIGFDIGWRIFFLGWSFDLGGSDKNNGTSFDLSLYSPKFGLDLMYLKTGNNYRIQRAKGFGDIPRERYAIEFDGLDVNIKEANLYYIFNNKRFSYPSAFSQTTIQRISCGSLILGGSISTHDIKFDSEMLPSVIQQSMNQDMKIDRIKYTNLSLSLGYAYNWVFAKNFLASMALSPVLALKASKSSNIGEDAHGFFNRFNIDMLVRAGVVYNNGKYYIGSSFLGRSFGYNQKNFTLNNGYGTLQVYAGFNFLKKKKYKKTRSF